MGSREEETWESVFEIEKEDILELNQDQEAEDRAELVKKEEPKGIQPTKPWWNMEVEWTWAFWGKAPIDEKGLADDIKVTLLRYLYYVLGAAVLHLLGMLILGIVTMAVVSMGMPTITAQTTRVLLMVILSPYGLLILPMRYGYIQGMVDKLRGKETESLIENYKDIKGFKTKIGLESILLMVFSALGIVQIMRSSMVNIVLSNYLLAFLMGITHIMILIRVENPNKGTKEIVEETKEMIEKNKKALLIMLGVMGFVAINGGVFVVYVPDMIITVLYLRYKTEERGDIDVKRDNGIIREGI